MDMQTPMKIAAAGILYALFEFLVPSGKIRTSAVVVLRMLVLLSVSEILRECLR